MCLYSEGLKLIHRKNMFNLVIKDTDDGHVFIVIVMF